MIVLLIAFSAVLFVPVLQIKAYFVSNDIVLLRVAHDLFFSDIVLFVIVFVFGIAIPACKMMASVLCWYMLPLRSWAALTDTLVYLGKLSMLDIILAAFVVVALKGVGVGTVRIQPGLYLYCAVVVSSYVLSLLTNSTVQMLYSNNAATSEDSSPNVLK